ncbi:developmentally-regulated protein [Acrasis kona]|uniref:Developmentally-regulated protein n=1 Tax=Acrasis kona TaxID=1008807 RepID=A0AAW2YW45_9EUKA
MGKRTAVENKKVSPKVATWKDRCSNAVDRTKRSVKTSVVSSENIIAKSTRKRNNVNYRDVLKATSTSKIVKSSKSCNTQEVRQKNFILYETKKKEKKNKNE